MPTPEPTEEQAWARWQEIAAIAQTLQLRINSDTEFQVEPGSSLSGDDKASDPFQVSHAVRACINAAVDHLHAAKCLVVDQGVLHTYGLASISRGALETAATGFWLIHPPRRDTRITRTLQWHMQNVHDQHLAADRRDIAGSRTREEKRQEILTLAESRSLPKDVIGNGYRSTPCVAYANQYTPVKDVVTAWQICSGLAHGRQWAALGALDREVSTTPDPGVANVRLTSNMRTSLHPALLATHLLEDLLRLFDQRSRQG